MKKLGVFITTHIQDYKRRCGADGKDVFKFYKGMINDYDSYETGLPDNDVDVFIMDTGSTMPQYLTWIDAYLKTSKITLKHIYNRGGVFASIKHIMHERPNIIDDYEYFFFHVDDSLRPRDGWALDLVTQHNGNGILCNSVSGYCDSEGFGQKKQLPHVTHYWGIKDKTEINTMDASFFVIDNESLRLLSKEWWYAKDKLYMNWQRVNENTNYATLRENNYDNCMIMHVGRELDLGIRIKHIDKNITNYTGTGVVNEQIGATLGRKQQSINCTKLLPLDVTKIYIQTHQDIIDKAL